MYVHVSLIIILLSSLTLPLFLLPLLSLSQSSLHVYDSLIEPGTDPVTGGGEGRSDRLSTHFDFCSSKKCSNYMYVVIDFIFTFPLSLSALSLFVLPLS